MGVLEGVVFISVGMSVLADRNHDFNFGFIAIAICACLLGRAVNTFPLSAGLNLVRKRKITAKTQFVMFFAGLRGAIAYALSPCWSGWASSARTWGTMILRSGA